LTTAQLIVERLKLSQKNHSHKLQPKFLWSRTTHSLSNSWYSAIRKYWTNLKRKRECHKRKRKMRLPYNPPKMWLKTKRWWYWVPWHLLWLMQ